MMLKEGKVFVLIIVIILLINICSPPPAFSQRSEFLRLRATPSGTPIEEGSSFTGEPVPEYYIATGDKLEVFVWENPDLTKDVTVRPDGKLSYPLVGTVMATGLTIDQLQNKIKKRLSEYVRVPVVTVSVKEAAGSKIIVLGQVGYPGVYTYKGSLSLFEAIAMAGDFTTDGHRESVMIISDNFTSKPKVRKIDALTALRNGTFKKEFMLKPNDIVYVPRSTIADFNKFLSDISPTINALTNILTLGGSGVTTATQLKGFFWHRSLKVISGD